MKKQTVLWMFLAVTALAWMAAAQPYTITLNYNYTGAQASITRLTDSHGSLMGEPLPVPTRAGQVFTGWFTTASTGGARVLVGATGTKFTQNAVIYARWSAAAPVSMSDIPAAMKENFDWLKNVRHNGQDGGKSERIYFNANGSVRAQNFIFDQIWAGNGTISWAVRWESDRVVTLAERQAVARMLHEEINKWTRPLIGMEGWPFGEIPVTVIGWAVHDESLIQDRQPNEQIWVNNTHQAPDTHTRNADNTLRLEFMASAPREMSRFINQAALNNRTYTYPGGLHNRFDMYLWATSFDFGAAGHGGDWGTRMRSNAIITAATGGSTGVLLHEIGHGFGFYDFYGGVDVDRPPTTSNGSVFGQQNNQAGRTDLRTIMHTAGGSNLFAYDQWMIRYFWDWIKTGSPSSRFPTYSVAVNSTGTDAAGAGSYAAGPNVTISAGTRSGYTFNGWITESAGVTFADENSATTTFAMPPNAVNVMANWAAVIYTVSFNASGGIGSMTSDNLTHSNNYTIKDNGFTRDGHTFTGWNTESDGSGTDYAAGAQISGVTADITLYAQWEKTNSVLSYDRFIPGHQPKEEAFAPTAVLAGRFTAGPNPVAKSLGTVNFYSQGKPVRNGLLTVFDASGNVVNRVKINDNTNGRDAMQDRRIVGSWNLTDAKGRKVSEGTYLVRGTVTAPDGKTERVSFMVGVR